MELFDATRQPLHRHLSFGKCVVQTLVLCKDWVVLKAQLPPQTAHSLVLGRSWFQNDGGEVPETPMEAQDFRVQALSCLSCHLCSYVISYVKSDLFNFFPY